MSVLFGLRISQTNYKLAMNENFKVILVNSKK